VRLSVVIPTYNRRDRLERVLVALSTQTTPPLEIVVVSDGSTDGTNDYIRSGETPVPVVAVVQDNAGPAAARNRGLDTARGEIVLFIDDDVVPAPDLVEQHVRAHLASSDDVVVIGPMLNPDDAELSPWVAWEQHQLYKQYDAMRRRVYDCTFRQFFTGNASVPRQRVIDVGHFDTNFRRAEDVELAFRLHQAGVGFLFVAEARGFHHAERSFDSWLATAFAYGLNDVTFISEGQDWLTTTLPAEFAARHPLVRALTRFCVPRPRASARAIRLLSRVSRWRWSFGPVQRFALSGLYNLNYYRGIAEGLGSADRFLDFIDGGGTTVTVPRVAFVLEQTLGHVTHSNNLHALLADSRSVRPTFLDIPYEVDGWRANVPGFGNWTVRAGLRARRAIRAQHRRAGIDSMFIHTQVPAVLTGRWMRRIPTIVSLDATPIQYDELGEHYAHDRSSARVEAAKKRLNERCFRRAHHLVAWSEWTRQGLARDYGVDPARVTVIAPGVDVERWARPSPERGDGPVRVLFVGGDLDRKGGRLLLDATRVLRADPTVEPFVLHLVTRTFLDPEPGVVVHNDMSPNSQALIALYHAADVFVLPTLGDCLPMVLSEAGVAELALISTDVGAIREIVRDGETGLLIEPGSVDALIGALGRLLRDPDLRTRLGRGAAQLVRQQFDAAANARQLEQLLIDAAAGRFRP
jgi:glycosyltransferase involved in cell wall biosynthesis